MAILVTAVAPAALAQAVGAGKNELGTELTFHSSKLSSDDADRSTSLDWTVSYGRFLTDGFAAGPVFRIAKNNDTDAFGYLGGVGRYYFGDLNGRFLPVAEVSVARSMNDPSADYTDLQVFGGVVVPMGASGARFRVGPYFYRAFYDEDETGYSNFQSFGVSWSVALLF